METQLFTGGSNELTRNRMHSIQMTWSVREQSSVVETKHVVHEYLSFAKKLTPLGNPTHTLSFTNTRLLRPSLAGSPN